MLGSDVDVQNQRGRRREDVTFNATLFCFSTIFFSHLALFSMWPCCVVYLYDGCLFSHAEATASHIIGSSLFVAVEKDCDEK